jgi:hypothetical protein
LIEDDRAVKLADERLVTGAKLSGHGSLWTLFIAATTEFVEATNKQSLVRIMQNPPAVYHSFG